MRHQANMCWKQYVLKLDTIASNSSCEMALCTDFGISLDLQAKDNHNHATNIFYVICGWKETEFCTVGENNQSLTKKTIISQCHCWEGFVDSLSKGKKIIMRCTLLSRIYHETLQRK